MQPAMLAEAIAQVGNGQRWQEKAMALEAKLGQATAEAAAEVQELRE